MSALWTRATLGSLASLAYVSGVHALLNVSASCGQALSNVQLLALSVAVVFVRRSWSHTHTAASTELHAVHITTADCCMPCCPLPSSLPAVNFAGTNQGNALLLGQGPSACKCCQLSGENGSQLLTCHSHYGPQCVLLTAASGCALLCFGTLFCTAILTFSS
jgi:hypothetical protein